MDGFCYRYDGTFAGFLSCVFAAYQHKEPPACFLTHDDSIATLYPERDVATNREHAERVYRALGEKISPEAQALVEDGFLCCLPERELHLYRFIVLGLVRGRAALLALTDDRISVLTKAVDHARHEAHLYLGFVRFSLSGGILSAEIEPKNFVLPLIQPHFCDRFSGEQFLIFDRTHRQALLSRSGRWVIAPMESLRTPAPDEAEQYYRNLWRRFHRTIAIEGRINPKCQLSHLPKRYRNLLTEFQPDEPCVAPLPPSAPRS